MRPTSSLESSRLLHLSDSCPCGPSVTRRPSRRSVAGDAAAGWLGAAAAGLDSAFSAGLVAPPGRCMSMLPRKCAPSAMATRGAAMSPSTEPLSRMSTFSLAVTLPVTSPRMTTDLANTWALILPFGPIVSTFCRSSILPSTWPSIVRSSLPLSSPLMTTDLPMFTVVFSIPRWGSLGALWVRAASAAGGTAVDAGTEPPAGTVGLTASSRFHIGNLHLSERLTSQGVYRLRGWAARPVYESVSGPV